MRTLGMMLTLAAFGLIGQAASAKDGCCTEAGCAGASVCADPDCCGSPNCCARCGRHAACQKKTCQLVCEVKKEKKHTWCVECEEFCTLLPGPRDRCCDACGENCCGNCCGRCCKQNPPPKCGRSKCVQKLVKKEYEVEVPVYKCVVLYLCCDCCQDGTVSTSLPPAPSEAAPLPPPPKVPNPAPGPRVPKKAPGPKS